MNHPYETNHNSNARHQQLMKAAAKARRVKSLSLSQPQLDLFGKLCQIFSLSATTKVEIIADPDVR